MSKKASVSLDTNRVIGQISPLLFSGFAEHMGRCIYRGIYEPGSQHADARGKLLIARGPHDATTRANEPS